MMVNIETMTAGIGHRVEDSSLKAGAPSEEAAPVAVGSTLTRLILFLMSDDSHLNVLRGGRMKGVRC